MGSRSPAHDAEVPKGTNPTPLFNPLHACLPAYSYSIRNGGFIDHPNIMRIEIRHELGKTIMVIF